MQRIKVKPGQLSKMEYVRRFQGEFKEDSKYLKKLIKLLSKDNKVAIEIKIGEDFSYFIEKNKHVVELLKRELATIKTMILK